MIEVKNITKKYGNFTAVDNISFEIKDRDFVGLIGHTGSGKSTLAKIIMGIEKADSGKIILDGQDITDMPINERAKLGIGFAFQQPVKFKGLTVYDLLKIAANKNITRKEACECLAQVGLCAKEYVDREVNSSLSGGELKRIEIANIVLRQAKLTIFDEPEAGIDLWSFNNLIQVFESIRENIKGTTIVISHQERILKIADEVILMRNGKIEKITTADEILGEEIVEKQCCKLKNGGKE